LAALFRFAGFGTGLGLTDCFFGFFLTLGFAGERTDLVKVGDVRLEDLRPTRLFAGFFGAARFLALFRFAGARAGLGLTDRFFGFFLTLGFAGERTDLVKVGDVRLEDFFFASFEGFGPDLPEGFFFAGFFFVGIGPT
jgi:hypothetical protein